MIARITRLLVRRKLMVAFVLVTLLGTVVFAESRGYNFDSSYVAVTGNLIPAQRAEVYARLLAAKSNIESIEDIKELLDAVPWVSHVNVMRHWPDRITVTVIPERAIATWNGTSFLDDNGIAFTSNYIEDKDLAHLYGPVGSEDEVMEQYQQLAKALGRAGRSISTLKLDPRGAWEFTTRSGIRVMLGKDDIMDRFQRFLLVLGSKQLAPRTDDIKRIDTRYSNGVAVSWKQVPTGLRVAKTDNY